MDTGGKQMIFEIPIDALRADKMFYGIYHEDGKGIYLKDIYIRFKQSVSVELDRQIYNPGEVIYAVFVCSEPGTLTAEVFGDLQTIELNSTGSANFVVPEEILSGTYGIIWRFLPTNPLIKIIVTQPGCARPYSGEMVLCRLGCSRAIFEKNKQSP